MIKDIKMGERMKNKYFYFLMGYATAILMAMVVSCTFTPLEAVSSECGENSWNPCFVKLVD